ncbi:hypothetical protein CLCR_11294 [Cladophialophora carrionii]|uniref:Uncharacterized protein n=1 Tax=Cladophialophora carrionii TaxID=86049 RepID=A0A1C1CIU8_9EURO|nr:hypothetical protein CLCR_11294 [Cladophialophora carrionii]
MKRFLGLGPQQPAKTQPRLQVHVRHEVSESVDPPGFAPNPAAAPVQPAPAQSQERPGDRGAQNSARLPTVLALRQGTPDVGPSTSSAPSGSTRKAPPPRAPIVAKAPGFEEPWNDSDAGPLSPPQGPPPNKSATAPRRDPASDRVLDIRALPGSNPLLPNRNKPLPEPDIDADLDDGPPAGPPRLPPDREKSLPPPPRASQEIPDDLFSGVLPRLPSTTESRARAAGRRPEPVYYKKPTDRLQSDFE